MDASQFDRLARSLAMTTSRRSLFGRVAGVLLGTEAAVEAERAAAKGKDKDKRERGDRGRGDEQQDDKRKRKGRGHGNKGKSEKPGNKKDETDECRKEDERCAEDDACCGGLVCRDTCHQPTPAIAMPSCRVDVRCAFDAASDQTRCECLATTGSDQLAVNAVILPPAEICVDVAGGDYVFTTANSPSDAAGYASPGPGQPLILVLEGNVRSEGSATSWCETTAGLVPATGPRLVRVVDDLSGETGAVIVQARICHVASPDAVTDWFRACLTPDAGATFALAPVDPNVAVPERSGIAAADGKLRFGQLPPGTYQLTLTSGNWCHAESDRVDANGHVVVEAERRTTVWTFRCGG